MYNKTISMLPQTFPINLTNKNDEKPELLNLACRSREADSLKTYQTRTDNLKPGELVKVENFFVNIKFLKEFV